MNSKYSIAVLVFITLLFNTLMSNADEILLQDGKEEINILNDDSEKKSFETNFVLEKTMRAIAAHKMNYFSINNWPDKKNAQVKFQISMKFPLLKPNLYILKYNLFPAYVAYTQKSLWNIGEKSMPFEENNYNPEFF